MYIYMKNYLFLDIYFIYIIHIYMKNCLFLDICIIFIYIYFTYIKKPHHKEKVRFYYIYVHCGGIKINTTDCVCMYSIAIIILDDY